MRSSEWESREKKTPEYRERNEVKRQDYLEEIKAFDKEKRIYLDESGLCRKLARTHGYATKGQRVHGLTYGKRQGRTNIIAAWSSQKKLFAFQSYEHSIKKVNFVDWIKTSLLNHLRKGMVVIMDNAPWHKGDDIKQLIESTGAKLLKLPPYSPDLNPIEHAWANLKAAVKKASYTIPDFHENMSTQIQAMRNSNRF